MTVKQIANPGQAGSLGASWGTPSVDTMPSEVVQMINGTSQVLYTGDIVSLDYTGTQVILPATGNLTQVIGVVGTGNASYPATTTTGTSTVTSNTFPTEVAPSAATGIWLFTGGGGFQPLVSEPNFIFTGILTTGSNTITSVSGLPAGVPIASMAGSTIITPYNATNNTTPQALTIISGSSTTLTLSGNVTLAAGSPWTVTNIAYVDGPQALGPGWVPASVNNWGLTSAFVPAAVVPIILRGYGRININGVSAVAQSDGIGATNAAVTGTRFAYASTGYANATGLIIGVALEAYAARDSYLSNNGVTGHDSIRAIIGKM